MVTEGLDRIGAIERVGPDGFIVEAADPSDPAFYGGKRLLPNFDHLIRFLAKCFDVARAEGATHGISGGNGKPAFIDTSMPVVKP